MNGRDRHNGFTLVELLVVVAIIIMLASVTVPAMVRGGWLGGNPTNSAARDLFALLRASQVYATTHNVDAAVAYGIAAPRDSLYTGDGGLLNNSVPEAFVPLDYLVSAFPNLDVPLDNPAHTTQNAVLNSAMLIRRITIQELNQVAFNGSLATAIIAEFANTEFSNPISDYDANGSTDFFAYGDADPSDPANGLDLWWFGRVAGPTAFVQRLVESGMPGGFISGAADLDNDDDLDVYHLVRNSGGYINSLVLYSYLNQGTVATANCAWTEDPTNPDGCVFIKQQAIDLTSWGSGLWIARVSADAVDVDGDGNRDVVMVTHSSGGTSPSPVTLLLGDGAGGFAMTSHPLFSHAASPVNSQVFADFNGDDLGDLIVGLDDDGDAGSAWFYPGVWDATLGYSISTAGAFESFDINPGAESGGENYGVTGSARSFDFDFDGNEDVIVGYNNSQPWNPPSETVFLQGNGNGTFAPATILRSFTNGYGQNFAIPQRLCKRFQITQ